MINTFITLLLLGSIFTISNCTINECDKNNENYMYVKDEAELIDAIKTIEDNGTIYLSNNIMINNKLEIKRSMLIDLNNHEIDIKSGTHGLICGNRKFNGTTVYLKRNDGGRYIFEGNDEYIPEHFDKKTKTMCNGYWVTTYKKRWIPKDFMTTIIKDKYEYDDDIDITIKNGTIRMENAANGIDAEDFKDFTADGTNGSTPSPVVTVVSGSLKLLSVKMYGGNGGNGGNGGYQKLYHLPFLTPGNGGNGGDAGNGGDVILAMDNSTISLDNSSRLVAGCAGENGKGRKRNPDYWIIPGSDGEDGEYGRNGSLISGNGKVIRVN